MGFVNEDGSGDLKERTQFGATVNGNMLDIAVLEWCKLFAAVRGITEHAVELVGGATEALLKPSDAEVYVNMYDAAQFEEAFRVLQQIPMLELGTVTTVEGVTLIKGALSAMSVLLLQLRTNPSRIGQDHTQVRL